MYNIWFYLFFWVLGIFLTLPIFVASAVWIFLRHSSSKNTSFTLEDIQASLKNVKNETDFRFVLQSFLKHFKVAPSEEIRLKHWFSTVTNLTSSKYFDTETLIAFGKELEVTNEEVKQEITDIINSSLKDRRKK